MTHQDAFHPLTDAELQRLDELLSNRVEDGDDVQGMDPGTLSLSELDGLFTAVCSSPVAPAEIDWQGAVWGELEPQWDSEAEYKEVLELLVRHLNTIAATLADTPDTFEPLFLDYEEEGEILTSVDDWCEGYIRGVGLSLREWKAGGDPVSRLLTPIRAFTSATDWRAHNRSSDEEFEAFTRAITPNVRQLYACWRK